MKILEFAGFRKSGSTKWRKPGTLLHDNLLEISQTENSLHNNCVSLTHLQIDACCNIVRCVFANISINWRTTISLLATPTCSGEIKCNQGCENLQCSHFIRVYKLGENVSYRRNINPFY